MIRVSFIRFWRFIFIVKTNRTQLRSKVKIFCKKKKSNFITELRRRRSYRKRKTDDGVRETNGDGHGRLQGAKGIGLDDFSERLKTENEKTVESTVQYGSHRPPTSRCRRYFNYFFFGRTVADNFSCYAASAASAIRVLSSSEPLSEAVPAIRELCS